MFIFQAEDGIRDLTVTGVQTCALPIYFHDVWINPENPSIVYTGDDGGLWRSEDGGTRWKHQLNLPVSQFYHVSVDMADPYHVYGGLQDNNAWVGDSSYPGGVTNSRLENMYNGDGFWMFEN